MKLQLRRKLVPYCLGTTSTTMNQMLHHHLLTHLSQRYLKLLLRFRLLSPLPLSLLLLLFIVEERLPQEVHRKRYGGGNVSPRNTTIQNKVQVILSEIIKIAKI